MKIRISVRGHVLPIRLASSWVPWDLGMSDFLICLPLCPCGHAADLAKVFGPFVGMYIVAWDAHCKQILANVDRCFLMLDF